MSRFLLTLAAVAALSGAAASSASAQAPAAPATHAGTRLSFPATLGGATLERSISYAAPPTNNPGQGSAYFYTTPKRLIVSVQVFDLGRRIPAGSDGPAVTSQFATELASAEQQSKFDGYTQFQKPSVPSACTYGPVSFRCITYSSVGPGNARVFSKLMLTGFRDHFVKILVTWSQSQQQSAADAEAALQAFVPAMLR